MLSVGLEVGSWTHSSTHGLDPDRSVPLPMGSEKPGRGHALVVPLHNDAADKPFL